MNENNSALKHGESLGFTPGKKYILAYQWGAVSLSALYKVQEELRAHGIDISLLPVRGDVRAAVRVLPEAEEGTPNGLLR